MAFDGKTIWMDGGERYFLIPDDHTVPEGPLALTSLLGRRRHVDPAAVAGFEISRQDALGRIRGHASGLVGLLKSALSEATRPPHESAATRPPSEDATPKTAAPSSEDRSHLDALKQEMEHMVAGLKDALHDALPELPLSGPRPTAPKPPSTEAEPAVERLLRDAAARLEELADRLRARKGEDRGS